MIDLSRRDLLVSGALAAAASAGKAASAFAPAEGQPPIVAAWDLRDLYPSDAAWDDERQALLKSISALDVLRGGLGNSTANLRTALQTESDLRKRGARLFAFASLLADEDRRIAANQERKQQAQDALTALGEATAWIKPEIVAIGAARVEAMIGTDPGLKTFEFGIRDTLRQAEHMLSASEEQLLASASSPLTGPSDVRNQLVASDIPRASVRLSDGRLIRLDDQGYTSARSASSQTDRKLVFDKFWASYNAFENSLGTALSAQVKGDMFRAKARHYDNALQAALDASNLPEAVYRALVSETNRGLPVLHRYFDVRRRILGLSDIGYWDIYVPLASSDHRYSIADMRLLTLDAIKPVGANYVRLFADASAKRWTDPFPRPGKASGAYSDPTAYDVHPYLMLNLTEDYDGLTTYAHEWGHAMHSLLTNSTQPYELSRYPTFIAEVASTTHELLLANMLVARAKSKEDKLFYLGQLMENYRNTFFRQVMLADFQLAINDAVRKGEGLSGEKMSALYLDLLKRYHGPRMQIEPVYASEWAYIQHFFRGFYVWQYATSITAADFFAQELMHGTPGQRDRYLEVLRAGGSDYGYELLKSGGVDMATFEPYRLIINSFSKVLDQVETLLA